MKLSRRNFLAAGGVVLTRPACLLPKAVAAGPTSTSTACTPLALFASARVPRRCRVAHALFAPRDPCDEVPRTLRFGVWRPQDPRRVELEFRRVASRPPHGGRLVIPKGDAAELRVFFPPQHVIEAVA